MMRTRPHVREEPPLTQLVISQAVLGAVVSPLGETRVRLVKKPLIHINNN